MHCSLPGFSAHRIFQARVLEWIAISYSRGSSKPRHQNCSPASPASPGRFFTTSTTWEAPKAYYLTSILLLIYPFIKHLLSAHYVVGTIIGTGCIVCLHGSYILVVQLSRSVVCDSLQPHELQHARPPCPSPTPGVHSNSCPLSQWCHPAISSSVVPFSSCPQSLPASQSFPMSQHFSFWW